MSNSILAPAAPSAPQAFDWPLCYEAEHRISEFLERFLQANTFARRLAERMRDETGTDFFEWVDHLCVDAGDAATLREIGFVEENVDAPAGVTVFMHPRAMMPRVLIRPGHFAGATPTVVAIRPESVAEFLAAHDLAAPIEGAYGARLRRALVHEERGVRLEAVERLGHRGFVVREPAADFPAKVLRATELFQTRKRDFADDADGLRH